MEHVIRVKVAGHTQHDLGEEESVRLELPPGKHSITLLGGRYSHSFSVLVTEDEQTVYTVSFNDVGLPFIVTGAVFEPFSSIFCTRIPSLQRNASVECRVMATWFATGMMPSTCSQRRSCAVLWASSSKARLVALAHNAREQERSSHQ
jgi:hypothetical protein